MTIQNATAYTIPGVAEPIPAEAVTELLVNQEVIGSITAPQQTAWYRFMARANVPTQVTFTGLLAKYRLQSYLPTPRGSANAHSPQPETTPSADVLTYIFQLAEESEVFLAVARIDGAVEASSYALHLSVAPGDRGSANAH